MANKQINYMGNSLFRCVVVHALTSLLINIISHGKNAMVEKDSIVFYCASCCGRYRWDTA